MSRVPERTCVGCRTREAKPELDRIVRRPDGSWTPLQTPSSSSGIGVRAVTEDGGAIGLTVEADGTQHGARWSPDGSAQVDSLPGGLTRFSYLAQNGKNRRV